MRAPPRRQAVSVCSRSSSVSNAGSLPVDAATRFNSGTSASGNARGDTPPATELRADSPRPAPGTTADTTDSAMPTTTPAATARPTHSQRVTT
ncbi:hypothetical protein [Actinopolyspora lacussalsi]|uniref:hypothetical protein n=1 Tax=Actinopolyspora righensis TaxID=995060 RepID=UPI001C318D39|nr:hypothetical protein [Actinopolyspora righensis]